MNDVPLKMNNNKNEHMIIINSKRQTNEKKNVSSLVCNMKTVAGIQHKMKNVT